MKLWQVIQWGNPKDGGNGWDTQCIVSAVDLTTAIQAGEVYIVNHNGHEYRDGKVDCINLLGDDGRPDGDPQLVIRPWVDVAMNMQHYKSWYRHPTTKEWKTQREMYGEDL